MSSLLPYLEKAMLVASLASSTGYTNQKPSSEKCFFWLGVSLAVISYILIIAGLGLYLAANYELPIALMVTGLVMLFTILCVVLGIRIYKVQRQRRIENAFKSATAEIGNALANVGDDLTGAFKDNAGAIALVVAVIGFLSVRKII